MISITEFKSNFLAIFRLMRDTGMYVDVHNRGHAYRIHVEDLGYRIERKYKKRSYTSAIDAGKCPSCGKLMLNSVCMNANCPSVSDVRKGDQPSTP